MDKNVKETWIGLLPVYENGESEFLMKQCQEELDSNLENMRYLNPRNITRYIRLESYEKWDEVYVLNLTWMGDSSEICENGYETL